MLLSDIDCTMCIYKYETVSSLINLMTRLLKEEGRCDHPEKPGNRCRKAVIKAASARVETISKGENPRSHASHNVIANRTPVIATFGHEFSPHCPRHANCTDEENGAK